MHDDHQRECNDVMLSMCVRESYCCYCCCCHFVRLEPPLLNQVSCAQLSGTNEN